MAYSVCNEGKKVAITIHKGHAVCKEVLSTKEARMLARTIYDWVKVAEKEERE